MDLNNNLAAFSCNNNEPNKNYHVGDTTLRLECYGHGGSRAADDGCRLVLGLGPTPPGINSNKKRALESNQGLSFEGDSVLELCLSHTSSTSKSDLNPFSNARSVSDQANYSFGVSGLDEGSTSAKKSGGYMPSLLLAPRMLQKNDLFEPGEKSNHGCRSQISSEPSAVSDYSVETSSDHQTTNSKKCKFSGCVKGARGTTSLCISHGGGQRCQKPGCNKGAESRTAYCKAHGGGKWCQHLGCTKSAEGQTEHCIAHGGGRRCTHPNGCTKAARGKSGLCIKHGGGKRCVFKGCTRSAEGLAGLCISHGGGKRCQSQGCTKGAQGSTMHCKAHGGGKRCVFSGCTKGAEGSTPLCKAHGGGRRCHHNGGGICPKSVHGGTSFCVAHGGGKRCVEPGCTKSARGRTDCCVRHGGGRRCTFEKCTKSAQGSTDLCKAHGGGRRCVWVCEGDKCEKFARGKSGLCAGHANNKKSVVGIGPQLFHGVVGDNYCLLGVSDCVENRAKRRQLIPAQVLVPLSMKSACFSSGQLGSALEEGGGGSGNGGLVVPEGRVHGGGLLSLLGRNLRDAVVHGI